MSSVVSSEHGSSSAAAAKAKASGSVDPSTGPSFEKAAKELKIEEITYSNGLWIYLTHEFPFKGV